MSGQTNLFQSSLITPQGKGSIQFSTGARLKSGTLKESVPVSVNDSVIEEYLFKNAEILCVGGEVRPPMIWGLAT